MLRCAFSRPLSGDWLLRASRCGSPDALPRNPLNFPAQSREEIAQDRNVEQNETSGMKPLPHQKAVEDELVEHIHEKDIFPDLKPAPLRRICYEENYASKGPSKAKFPWKE